jgi:hypothetical protein
MDQTQFYILADYDGLNLKCHNCPLMIVHLDETWELSDITKQAKDHECPA